MLIRVSDDLVPYEVAWGAMDGYVKALQAQHMPECIWFLEHISVYTGGRMAKESDILDPSIPYVPTNRGGQITYHGPGQLIMYAMIDLKTRNLDASLYVNLLENWIIDALSLFGIKGQIYPDHVGVWVDHKNTLKKIAALGIRVSKGYASHGVALNYAPDLSAYNAIVPCGIFDKGVTSLQDLGVSVTKNQMIRAFLNTMPRLIHTSILKENELKS